MKQPKMLVAANDHVVINFEEFDSKLWSDAVKHLEIHLGFSRCGERVAGLDEGILPSFVNGKVSIEAGWDNWSGNYLLSTCGAGDKVLSNLFMRFS
ncbi:hypothetical protein [Alteromonas gracilis]|uniref:hypothetical protein n=1 Tax=Alteromonas gracilis TaxID=1479524 RepID=UPI0030CB9F21